MQPFVFITGRNAWRPPLHRMRGPGRPHANLHLIIALLVAQLALIGVWPIFSRAEPDHRHLPALRPECFVHRATSSLPQKGKIQLPLNYPAL